MQKRPPNGYMLFCIDNRKSILDNEKGHSNVSVMKRLGELWVGLSAAEKEPYIERAKRLQDDFTRENPEYHYKRRKTKGLTKATNSKSFMQIEGMSNGLIDSILQIGYIYSLKQISSILSSLILLPDPMLSLSILQEPQMQNLFNLDSSCTLQSALHVISIAHQHLISSNLFQQGFQSLQDNNQPVVTQLGNGMPPYPKLSQIITLLSSQAESVIKQLEGRLSMPVGQKQSVTFPSIPERPSDKGIPVMPPFFGPV